MASLTQSAIVARKTIRWGIYAVILLIVGRMALGVVGGIVNKIFPPKPPPPKVGFGRLAPMPFPENATDPTKLTYTLETPDGKLPILPDQTNVYYMPKQTSSLTSVQTGTETAGKLGFRVSGEKITETLYKFKHPSLPKTLELNFVTNVFSLSYDLAADPTSIEIIPPTPELAASQVRSYLSSAGLLPEDLSGPIDHQFLRVEQGNLVNALSQSEAQLIRVNLYRKAFEEIPSVTPQGNRANVWFLLSGSSQQERRILAGEFHYFAVDETQYSTYPIKTAEVAWADLTQGNAFIAKSPGEGNVVIRRVYLAYFDPNQISDFYQPVVVFSGDDFLAYVPAITPEYYGE